MKITDQIPFKGVNIYVGIDVHLNSWDVSLYSNNLALKSFKQPAQVELLVKHLKTRYPGANFLSTYEAGFCGFNLHKKLIRNGIDNIVINPADVPSTNKDKNQKRDRIDSRKLGLCLRGGLLKGIYVPSDKQIHDRLLLRTREQLKNDLKRCKHRIKSCLHFLDLQIPPELVQSKGYWKKDLVHWIKELQLEYTSGRVALDNHLIELEHLNSQIKQIKKDIVELAHSVYYEHSVKLLRSIPGISLLASMVILTEIGDIKRFKSIDELCSYVGLIPKIYASGEREYVGGITSRSNNKVRRVLIESSWWLIRKDPAMTASYEVLRKRMNGNKAIIRIAKKLLSRIRYVLINQTPYQLDMK